jgi:hypothetical protein
MAFRNTNDIKKIILLILLIVLMVIAGYLGIKWIGMTFRGISIPLPGLEYLDSLSLKKKIKQSEDPYLLEREELSKEKDRLAIINEQITNREKEILAKETDVNKKLEAINEREKNLDTRQKSMDEVDKQKQNRQTNIREQAVKVYNMPPKDGVALLEKQSESDIVDILREIDAYSTEIGKQSISPYLLKLLGDINKDKAGNVLRKLKYSSEGSTSSVETIDSNTETPPAP